MRVSQQVDVIAGDSVGQKRGIDAPERLPEAVPIAIPILGKPEQELPVVAAVSQMVNPSRQNVAIGPRHGTEFSCLPGTIQPRKEASKLSHAALCMPGTNVNPLRPSFLPWSDQNKRMQRRPRGDEGHW